MPPRAPLQAALSIQAAVTDTILDRLAVLFLTGADGNTAAARAAAAEMLAAYHARTEEELYLAANIIAFSFQSLEALGQACDPGLSPTQILRLRNGAVSLGREADKARHRLAQLQKTRKQPEPAPDPIKAAVPVPPAEKPTWTQAFQQREGEENRTIH